MIILSVFLATSTFFTSIFAFGVSFFLTSFGLLSSMGFTSLWIFSSSIFFSSTGLTSFSIVFSSLGAFRFSTSILISSFGVSRLSSANLTSLSHFFSSLGVSRFSTSILVSSFGVSRFSSFFSVFKPPSVAPPTPFSILNLLANLSKTTDFRLLPPLAKLAVNSFAIAPKGFRNCGGGIDKSGSLLFVGSFSVSFSRVSVVVEDEEESTAIPFLRWALTSSAFNPAILNPGIAINIDFGLAAAAGLVCSGVALLLEVSSSPLFSLAFDNSSITLSSIFNTSSLWSACFCKNIFVGGRLAGLAARPARREGSGGATSLVADPADDGSLVSVKSEEEFEGALEECSIGVGLSAEVEVGIASALVVSG